MIELAECRDHLVLSVSMDNSGVTPFAELLSS